MRAFRCFLAALLAAGIVTMVAAQPGRFGGFGGFGGTDVEGLVFTNAALQQEVKLTDAQKEKIKPVTDKMSDLSKKGAELFGGGFKKGGSNQEKFTEFREQSTKVAEERKKVYDEVLTADQKKRLKQIQIQAMSVRVFTDPEAKGGGGKGGKGGKGGGGFFRTSEEQRAIMKEVQDSLKLTDSQKSSIKGIVSDFNQENQEIMRDSGAFSNGKFDPEKMEAANKKVDKARKEAMGKIEDLFDENQKKTWKTLTGEPFDVSKLRQAPPRKD